MAVNVSLIMIGTLALSMGVGFYFREKNRNTVHNTLLVSSICVFMWNIGYALLGFNTNYALCTAWRVVGLAGIIFFICNEVIFVRYVTGLIKKHFAIIHIPIVITGIAVLCTLGQPSTVNWVRINGRTAYYSNPSFARTFESIYIGAIFLFLLCMGIIWLIRAKHKREREMIIILVIAHCMLMISIIPDTVLPIMGLPSFPSTCYGAFVCFIANLIVADKFNGFSISLANTANYIYHNVDTSVIVLDDKHVITKANDFAMKFFNIESVGNSSFDDMFVIPDDDRGTEVDNELANLDTPENVSKDGKVIFDSVEKLLDEVNKSDLRNSFRLKEKDKDIFCSVNFNTIFDKYHEPMCTVCMIYDLSKEEQKFNEVNELKIKLQKDLKKKTRELEALTLQSITAIAATIDAKDMYTKGHSIRVADYSVQIAKELRWGEEELQNLRYVALLHDIGKIGVPDSILKKNGPLTNEEYDQLKTHTTMGAEILKDMKVIPDLDFGAKYHHERYDGKGYPSGLYGEDIPIYGRIIAVADAFDAMNSKRVYRNNLPGEIIEQELLKGRATQFDPDILDIFYEMYKKGLVHSDYETDEKYIL